jgi:hypothetical protein
MRHFQAGAVVGAGILLGGVVWNMLGDSRAVIIALAVATTIIVALIDWYTEQKEA